MKAKKCDRCHKFYDIYEGENILLTGETDSTEYDYVEARRWDLCPDCMKDILFYIKNGGGPTE